MATTGASGLKKAVSLPFIGARLSDLIAPCRNQELMLRGPDLLPRWKPARQSAFSTRCTTATGHRFPWRFFANWK
jgi:hypothetical protein